MSELEKQIAGALLANAVELAARWRDRAPIVTGVATHVPADRYRDTDMAVVELVRAVANSLVAPAGAASELAWAGWSFGAASFGGGGALHQVLQELHLVQAILLHGAERAIGEAVGSPREGLAVARELQRSTALASLAAVRGYTHAHLDRQRDRLRMLRHDLRNPIGTIRNAIALLEDDSVPTHLRDPERFRAIVARNAEQADALVARDLADGPMLDAALAPQEIAIADVALAVRRELRSAAEAMDADIVIADDLPVVSTDVAALELALLAVVSAALEGAVPCQGERRNRFAIETDGVRDRSVRLRIGSDLGPIAESSALALARDLTRWAGGELSTAGAPPGGLVLELPASRGHSRDDLARTGEG